MNKSDRIFVAGHRGLVGAALVRRLESAGHTELILRTRAELDLREQASVREFFSACKPDYVFLAAANVGGIHANSSRPADFIRDNLLIQSNVIDAAWRCKIRKLVFLGSSCIYPRQAPQPMREDALLSGPLEPTNEWYAVAKIAGIKLCQAYRRQYGFDAICVMPTNLYGPGDNFDLQASHVLPALIRKFHEARRDGQDAVTVWGTGNPRREFLHVDDLADAVFFLARNYSDGEIINVGTGQDITIRELAELVAKVVGFPGQLIFDTGKPDGPPRKLLDITRLTQLGWQARVTLRQGLEDTYRWYVDHLGQGIRGL